jgi:hypothetical protein
MLGGGRKSRRKTLTFPQNAKGQKIGNLLKGRLGRKRKRSFGHTQRLKQPENDRNHRCFHSDAFVFAGLHKTDGAVAFQTRDFKYT